MLTKKIKRKIKNLLVKYVPAVYSKINKYRLRKRMISRYSREEAEKVLTIYSLGLIEFRKDYEYEKLEQLLKSAEFCVAYLNEYNKSKIETLKNTGIKAFCVSNKVKNDDNNPDIIKENSFNIFKHKNIKIGIINFNSKNDTDTLFDTIKELKKKVKYIMVYISYDELNEEVEKLFVKVAKRTNQVIGINNKEILPFDIARKTRKALFSIGSFINLEYKENDEKDSIILKNVIKKFKKKIINLERCYIPCSFDENSNSIKRIEPSNKETLKSYRNLNRRINNIVDEDRILTVEKLFNIFQMEIPEKYEVFKSIVVRRIAVLPNEIEKCSVLFVREYDSVVHEVTEEEYYKKLINRLRRNARRGLILAFSPIKLPSDIPHVVVKSSLALHSIICKKIIDSCYFDIKVAVTGSTGKTSTKEMIALVLSKQYETFKNTGNENLQIKMGLMLKEFSPKYEAYIQEVGGGKIGGASSFSKILEPDVGVVTNIGYSHLRWSKTREQLAINKVGIADGIRNNGPLFINIDNDILQKTDVSDRNVITYSIDNKEADYTADNIILEENKILFDIVHKDKKTKCVLNTPGKYNIYNALVSFGIGRYAGIPEEKICEGIAEFKPEGIRQTLMQIGGYNLFVDCYNAAPNSMVGAVETLAEMGKEDNKKIAVLADMTGMEELSEDLHADVGKKISKCDIDYLICYGNDIKYAYDNFTNSNTIKYLFDNKEDVIDTIKKIIKPGDYILFKGSSKFKLEEDIIDEILGTNLSTLAHDRRRVRIVKKANASYQIFPHNCHLIAKNNNIPDAIILSKINGKPVISIGKSAFENKCDVERVELSEELRNIQECAFKNCVKLGEINLPEKMQIIEDNVFENCTNLNKVYINEKLIHIGKEAFKNCNSLKSIELHENISFIGENAFDGCDDIEFICYKDSYADVYAKRNNIKVKYC